MDLLERRTALDILQRIVTITAAGQSAVVTVTGEAGIGKTSLLHTMLANLPSTVNLLHGSCDDLLTARPLGPLRDAAAGTGGALEAVLRDGHADEVLGSLIAEMRLQSPVLLVVDDLQWADEASLDVFAQLVRRIDQLPGSLVFTVRGNLTTRDHPLFGLLAGAARPRVHLVALAALSVEAVTSMAVGSGWDPQSLHELTSGNPFFVSELLAAPHHEGVPDTVAAAVTTRLGRLAPRCRRALEQLSVVPRMVDLGLAEALLGAELASLAEAEEAGLLDVDSEGIRFRHELARRAVESSVPRLRLRSLHAAVVPALLGRPAPDIARIVHHCVNADDEDGVSRYAPHAGREAAAAGSHRQALVHFESALRFADRLRGAEHARLLDDYGWELYNAHRFEQAVQAGEAAVERFAGSGEPAALAEALGRLSRYHAMLGATDAALAASGRATAVLTMTGSPGASAAAAASHASLLALAGESGRATAELDRAEGLAVAAHRPDLLALCRNYQSIARQDVDPDTRIGLVRESLRMALAQGNQEYTARGYTNLAELLYRYGRFDELAACLSDGLRYTEDRGFRSHGYNLEVHRCLLMMRKGAFGAATHDLIALIDRGDDSGVMRDYSRPSLLRLKARTGELGDGSGQLAAWRSAREHRFLTALAFAATALAEWCYLADRSDLAEQLHAEWLPYADRPGAEPATGEVLRYCARAGADTAPRTDVPWPWSAGLTGDFVAAAAAWRANGDRYEQALELIESNSTEETLTALGILDGLGATPAARLARRRLKALGMRAVPRGPMPQTRANPARLTRRELDVLELLVSDMTNPQIARQLVLSVRTVDHHVSSILAKLNVHTRRAAKDLAEALLATEPGRATN